MLERITELTLSECDAHDSGDSVSKKPNWFPHVLTIGRWSTDITPVMGEPEHCVVYGVVKLAWLTVGALSANAPTPLSIAAKLHSLIFRISDSFPALATLHIHRTCLGRCRVAGRNGGDRRGTTKRRCDEIEIELPG